MRTAAAVLALGLTMSWPRPAWACKELVVFPDRLEAPDTAKYYVVAILRADVTGFEGEIRQAFGGPFPVGATVRIRFLMKEEAHAVCPIELAVGRTYLLRSEGSSSELLVSRFNWLNVPSSHPRFAGYVGDLTARNAR